MIDNYKLQNSLQYILGANICKLVLTTSNMQVWQWQSSTVKLRDKIAILLAEKEKSVP